MISLCIARKALVRLCLVFTLLPSSAHTADSAHFFNLNTGDLKAELSDARNEGKKALMMFFDQEGCPGCRHMKENVFSRRDVQAYYRRNFASLALDVHGSVPLRGINGQELSEKGYAQSIKVRATPTFIFYDLAGNEIVRLVGTVQTPEEFVLLGEYVTSGAYKSRTFAQYKLEQPIRNRPYS